MQFREPKMRAVPPAGSHLVVITGIVELGTQPDTFGEQGATKRLVEITFRVLVKKDPEVYEITSTMTASLHTKARLRGLAECALQRELTVKDRRSLNARELLGKPLLARIGQKVSAKTSKPYGTIEEFAKAPDKTVIPDLADEFLFCGVGRDDFDANVFDQLPTWTQQKIIASPEFGQLAAIGAAPPQASLPPPAKPAFDDELPPF